MFDEVSLVTKKAMLDSLVAEAIYMSPLRISPMLRETSAWTLPFASFTRRCGSPIAWERRNSAPRLSD